MCTYMNTSRRSHVHTGTHLQPHRCPARPTKTLPHSITSRWRELGFQGTPPSPSPRSRVPVGFFWSPPPPPNKAQAATGGRGEGKPGPKPVLILIP